MNWLVKSEPSTYSWDKLVEEKRAVWDGVRNFTARNNLKAMKKGDQVFFYHSNEGLEIVGIAEVETEAYQDPTTNDTKWVVVDLKPVRKLNKPVTLATIKADSRLQELALVKQGRLSVSEVSDEHWKVILELSETK